MIKKSIILNGHTLRLFRGSHSFPRNIETWVLNGECLGSFVDFVKLGHFVHSWYILEVIDHLPSFCDNHRLVVLVVLDSQVLLVCARHGARGEVIPLHSPLDLILLLGVFSLLNFNLFLSVTVFDIPWRVQMVLKVSLRLLRRLLVVHRGGNIQRLFLPSNIFYWVLLVWFVRPLPNCWATFLSLLLLPLSQKVCGGRKFNLHRAFYPNIIDLDSNLNVNRWFGFAWGPSRWGVFLA